MDILAYVSAPVDPSVRLTDSTGLDICTSSIRKDLTGTQECGIIFKSKGGMEMRKLSILKKVCAWCGKDLGTVDGQGVEGISGGICPKCAAIEYRKLDSCFPRSWNLESHAIAVLTGQPMIDYVDLVELSDFWDDVADEPEMRCRWN